MGGQNHQPTCRVTTSPSAWLSQKVGEGFIGVLEANNHLENAIMLGMDRVYVEDVTIGLKDPPLVHLDRSIECLKNSARMICEIQLGFERVLAAAASERYLGNPLAHNLPSLGLQTLFESNIVLPQANSEVWRSVESRISSINIIDTLRWERSTFDALKIPLEDLIAVLKNCRKICEEDGASAFVNAIENNEIPLRQHYAQVFSLWNSLHAMFLYSALMMTELFYRANGFPSLLHFDPANSATTAA